MASNQYLILDISSPSKHETIQIVSISLNSEEGDIQILPTHTPWTGTHKAQELIIELNDTNHNKRSIHISEAISKLVLDESQRTKLTILCKEYSNSPISASNQIDQLTQTKIQEAKSLASQSLTPSLSPDDLELREIETGIRKEFEDELK
jgi:F0F1-type ATP synthase epsilon subunit